MQIENKQQRTQNAAKTPASASPWQPLELLILLFQNRVLVLCVTIGTGLLASLLLLVIPKNYVSTTVIMPPQQNSAGTALLGQLGGSSSLAMATGANLFKNTGEMYVSILRSRTIEDAMIKRYNLMSRYHKSNLDDARVAFEKHIKVVNSSKDSLITITVIDHDRQMAADMANGYVEEFRKTSATLAIGEASQRRAFFQQQLLDAKEKLAAAEDAMKGTQKSTGILQIDSQTKALIESSASLRAQVVAKQVQLQGMQAYATNENPNVQRVREQLSALQSQLASLGGTEQGNSMIVPEGKVPQAGLDYIRKLRDVKYYDTISELIARQFEMAKLDEARQGAIIQVLDPAVASALPSSPKPILVIVIGTLLGLIFSCLLCVFRRFLKQERTDPERQQYWQNLYARFSSREQ